MSTYKKSITDILSDALSPVLRKLNDINNNLFGTEIQLLRIRKVPAGKQLNQNRPLSVLGDYKYSYESDLITNASINYPFNEIRLFGYRGNESLNENKDEMKMTSVAPEELLPIKMYLSFEGNVNDVAVNVQEGDLILDILYDNNINCIPILLEVKRLVGSFFQKNLTGKVCELSLVRGGMDSQINSIIENRITSITARENLRKLNQVQL